MINKNDIIKLERFSKGLSEPEEEKYIYFLFSKNEGNKVFEKQIKKKFNVYLENNPDEDHNLSYLLDRIYHNIHKIESRKKQTLARRIYKSYSRIAAVLLIPLFLAGGIWSVKQNQKARSISEAPANTTLFAPLGSRISFSLPDGTHGWLNSGSSLEYSIPFNQNRHIKILGEAWFDVAYDPNHPFEIIAGDSKLEVLGTKFNINAYPEDEFIEVVLEEGKVGFSISGCSSIMEMKPNDRLVFSDGKINVNKCTAEKYSAWREGKLVFRGDSMAEVVRRIKRWYNIDIELVDKELEKYIIRGTFQDDSLEEVLGYLKMTSPIRYRIQDGKMLPDGTWQKQKIFIFKK